MARLAIAIYPCDVLRVDACSAYELGVRGLCKVGEDVFLGRVMDLERDEGVVGVKEGVEPARERAVRDV